MESQQQMLKQNVHVFIWVDYIQPQVCILECGVKKYIYIWKTNVVFWGPSALCLVQNCKSWTSAVQMSLMWKICGNAQAPANYSVDSVS